MAEAPIPIHLLEHALRSGANDSSAILSVRHVAGGEISLVARVETEQERYCAKWQPDNPRLGRALFDAEAEGLSLLRQADSGLVIPIVCGQVASDEGALLLLSWLDSIPSEQGSATALGRGLARQHRHMAEAYGLGRDNFIGMTPQSNGWYDNWSTFFAERRLAALAEQLVDAGLLRSTRARRLENLILRLPERLSHDPVPSLLHGDLWHGNWLSLPGGRAAVIDPAVYYGDREVDIAMTRLFGGFPAEFYESYEDAWPLPPGAGEREPIYNLYHLLNHLLHYGESYGPQVDKILAAFT